MGVSRPTPVVGGVQAQACISQHALRQTPPPQQTATAAGGTVRILLECILVEFKFSKVDFGVTHPDW